MINKWGNFKNQKCCWLYLLGEEVNLRDCGVLVMKAHELHTWSSVPEYWSRRSLEHYHTIITTWGGAKISQPANWQYGNKNQPSSSANHCLHLHNVPRLNKSKPLRRETTHYVLDTQLNKFIRAPPHVRFMLQLPWNSSTDNNYNHFPCICNNWYTCMKKLWNWNVFIAKIESLLLLLSMHSQRYHFTTNVNHISMLWWRNYNNYLQLKWVQWLNGLINFWFWGKPNETTHSPLQTDSLVVYILI